MTKWMKNLTKRDLRHLAESNASGRATIASLKANLEHQRKAGCQCFECESIARKLSIPIPTAA